MTSLDRLTRAEIRRRIHQYTPTTPPIPDAVRAQLRAAAVLVPLLKRESKWHLLLTRRAEQVGNHKGQVAFPGGAMEPQDASLEVTAVRETAEELDIPPEFVNVAGRLPAQVVISGFLVTPVVAFLPSSVRFRPAPAEIARVFTVPLTWVANPKHVSLAAVHMWLDIEYPVYRYRPYQGEIIWGLTARIIQSLVRALRQGNAGDLKKAFN